MDHYGGHGIKIYRNIIQANGTTINARSVSSVEVQHLNGRGGCLLLVGLCCLLGAVLIVPFQSEYSWSVRVLNVVVGIVLGSALIWWGKKSNGHYTVVLEISGAEDRIFTSKDRREADMVRDAVVRAMRSVP